MSELASTAAGREIGAILTCQLAELSFVNVGYNIAREEALVEVPLEADGTSALAVDTQL